MPITRTPFAAVAAVALAASAASLPSPAAADPVVLAESDLDAVTAGGIAGVFVHVSADAFGDQTLATTRTRTEARQLKHISIARGGGTATAIACCGDGADVEVFVASVPIAEGDVIRHVTRSQVRERELRNGLHIAHGYTFTFVAVR